MNEQIAWLSTVRLPGRRDAPSAVGRRLAGAPDFHIECPDTSAAFTVDKNAAFFDWWSRADPGACPHRRLFDIVEHPDWAANVFLIRVESRDPWVYRFRLIGDEAIRLVGHNDTGLTLSETGWDRFDQLASRAYGEMMMHRRPLRFHGRLSAYDKAYAQFESVDAPFLGADGRVTTVIGLICRA